MTMMEEPAPAPEMRRSEFARLYESHGREVWAIAYARRMDSGMAMDIAQEAFLRLWKHWENGGDAIQNVRAWLIRVARNLAEDYAKSAFRRNGTQNPQMMSGVGSRDRLPLEQMEREETFGQLRNYLLEMSPADRDLLTFRYALDYDAAQIAEILGINATAVHMRLSRARQRLADKLSANGINGAP